MEKELEIYGERVREKWRNDESERDKGRQREKQRNFISFVI